MPEWDPGWRPPLTWGRWGRALLGASARLLWAVVVEWAALWVLLIALAVAFWLAFPS
jgi:hypothetical protein